VKELTQYENKFDAPIVVPEKKPRDDSLMKAGERRTFKLSGVTIIRGIVENFSSELPEDVVKQEYSDLDAKTQKMIDDLEPDEWPSGGKKEKLQHQIMLHFTEVETGWLFRYDVKFYQHQDGRPKKDLYEFMKKTGKPVVTGTVGDFIQPGDLFTAVVVEKDSFMHIDPATLEPYMGA
jgi:hypothetical protein